MRPSGAWGYGLIGFTLILLIRGWARGGGFSLILASVSCTVQAITEGVCVCVCVCLHTCMPAQGGEVLVDWGTRQKTHQVLPLWLVYAHQSGSHIPGCLLVEDVKASGQTLALFKSRNLCYVLSLEKLKVYSLQEFKNWYNLVWFHFFTL